MYLFLLYISTIEGILQNKHKISQRFTLWEVFNFKVICGHINQNLTTHLTTFFFSIIFRYSICEPSVSVFFSRLNHIVHLRIVKLNFFSVYLIIGMPFLIKQTQDQHELWKVKNLLLQLSKMRFLQWFKWILPTLTWMYYNIDKGCVITVKMNHRSFPQ